MSLRSFLSSLTSSTADPPRSVPRRAPASFDQARWLGVGTVRRAALSPGGDRVAVATSLGVAVFPTTGEREIWWRETDGWAISVAFSADGSRVIAGTGEGRAAVWRADDGEPVATFSAAGQVHVALDRSGERAVLGHRDGVALWDVAGESQLHALPGTEQEVLAVAYDPAGDRVAAADYHGQVLVWDAGTGREVARWRPGDGPLRGVAFSADGGHVAAVGKSVTIWELTMGVSLHTATAPGPMISVAFDSAGERVVTGTKRNKGLLWSLASGERTGEIGGHIDDVHSVAFSPAGVLLGSQKVDWTPVDADAPAGALPTLARATRVTFSGDGAVLALADKQLVTLWDPATGEARAVLDGHTHSIGGVVLAGDAVLSHSPREVIVWNAADGSRRFTLRGGGDEPGHVGGACPLQRGSTVLAAVEEHAGRYSLALWDAASGDRKRDIADIPRRLAGIAELVASPDGRFVAVRSGPRVAIWDVASGEEASGVTGVAQADGCVLWDPDGVILVAALADGTVAFHDPTSGRRLRAMSGDGAAPAGLALSRDGTLLAGWFKAREADRVTMWDARSGKVVYQALQGGGEVCHCLAFRPDNSTLVGGFSARGAGSSDQGRESGLWVAWHVATGEAAASRTGPAIWAAGFDPGGDTLVTASGDGQATVWTVSD